MLNYPVHKIFRNRKTKNYIKCKQHKNVLSKIAIICVGNNQIVTRAFGASRAFRACISCFSVPGRGR